MRLPITIGLRRSRFQETALAAIALLAGLAAIVYPRDFFLRLLLLLAICWIALRAWRRLTPPLSAIRLEAGGEIQVAPDGETFQIATIQPGATVHPWLTSLRLESADGKRHRLLLTPGTATPDDFRRLRIFLRWRVDFNATERAGDAGGVSS